MDPPAVRYAHSSEASIAYQVAGQGPPDLAYLMGPASHSEMLWSHPLPAAFLERLAAFSRLIVHDRRGTGLSDPWESAPIYEQQVEDLLAVLDDAGAGQVALFGSSEAGRVAAIFAATYPERVTSLILAGVAARGRAVLHPEYVQALRELVDRRWGSGGTLDFYAPSLAADEDFRRWYGHYERAACSPGMARKLIELISRHDIADVLPAVRVPTLVLQRRADPVVPPEEGREVADLVPGARYVELPGDDHLSYGSGAQELLDEVEEFVTGERRPVPADRVLVTVLFTDIVGSTQRAAAEGDARWRDLLDRHDALFRHQLARFGGREVKATGDGFLAAFDGPARAVSCARAAAEGIRRLGLELRAGVHTGECERRGDDLGGLAVHIGARVMALAGPGEVLVSSTVKDLVVGSGLEFEDRGEHDLRGAPGTWRLYAAGQRPGTPLPD